MMSEPVRISDHIRGKTIRWSFDEGPMANRTFEHAVNGDGSFSLRILGGKSEARPTRVAKCEVATLGADVYSLSCLGSTGYTLTVVLDYRTSQVVAFTSNEKQLCVQRAVFEEIVEKPAESGVVRRSGVVGADRAA